MASLLEVDARHRFHALLEGRNELEVLPDQNPGEPLSDMVLISERLAE
jgi:hypothetical protein